MTHEAHDHPRECDGFDPLDAELLSNPYVAYENLRRSCPVTRSARYGGFWVASRYDDVRAVAQDPATFSSASGVSLPALGNKRPMIPIEIDPPDHGRYRALLNRQFVRAEIELLEPSIRKDSQTLLDNLPTDSSIDLMDEFCYAQPMLAMWRSPFFGPPVEGALNDDWRVLFTQWVRQFKFDPDATAEAAQRIREYLAAHLRSRKRAPQDDMPSLLLQARIRGRSLSTQEILDCLFLFFSAGSATTSAALGSILWYLAVHDDLRQRLAADLTLIPSSVEELLRLVGPSHCERRTLTVDRRLGGEDLKKGDSILILWASANRDDAKFTAADDFQPDRDTSPSLAFGAGIHMCIGAHLARLQLRVAIEELLLRAPKYQVDLDAVRWDVGLDRAPSILPTRLRPDDSARLNRTSREVLS
jgi:cytochrome P450